MQFKMVTCTGENKPLFCSDAGAVDFTVVTKRNGDNTSYENCEFNNKWNSYLCTGENHSKIGQLVFESLDGDTLERSV